MTFAEAKTMADALNGEVDRTSRTLHAFPRGATGLTPDAIRATNEWKTARAQYDAAAVALRAFNGFYTKTFAKEIRAERRARRAAP